MRSSKVSDKCDCTINVRLSREQLNYITTYCNRNHITTSQFIRLVINNLIYREESKK